MRGLSNRFVFFLALAAALAALMAPAAPDDSCGLPPGTERCATWSTRTPAGGGGRFNKVLVSPDGARVYASGYGSGAGLNFLTVAHESTGAILWTSQYDGPGSGSDQVLAAALSPDGSRLFVAGPSSGDYATIAYSTTDGTALWVARYNGPLNRGETANAIAVSDDGARVYVTGYSDGAGVNIDAATVAYNAATGAQLWVDRYDGPAGSWDIATAIDAGNVLTETGSREMVFITSRSNVQGTGNSQVDVMTVAYDGENGARLWETAFNGPAGDRDYPYALELSPDGRRVYVAAESVVPAHANDYATLAFDSSTGTILWSALFDSGFGDDRALSVAVSPAGDRVFVTGFTPNAGGLQGSIDRSATTVAYDADGNRIWVAKNTSPGGQAASAIQVTPDGRGVVVTGLTVGQAIGFGVFVDGVGGTNYLNVNGFLTIEYDAENGARRWFARYGDPGSARAVAISADGRWAYVAGGGNDAVTVAYEASS